MSANFKQKGEVITYTNSGQTDISYKDIIDLGTRIAVAAADIAAGESGSADVVGVFEAPAVNNAAFSQGEALYWDASAGKMTNTPGDLTYAGWCFAAKTETGTTVLVKIG